MTTAINIPWSDARETKSVAPIEAGPIKLPAHGVNINEMKNPDAHKEELARIINNPKETQSKADSITEKNLNNREGILKKLQDIGNVIRDFAWLSPRDRDVVDPTWEIAKEMEELHKVTAQVLPGGETNKNNQNETINRDTEVPTPDKFAA